MVAALNEPADSEEENDDNIETDGDGPLWQLFDQLYNAPNSSGMLSSYIFFVNTMLTDFVVCLYALTHCLNCTINTYLIFIYVACYYTKF